MVTVNQLLDPKARDPQLRAFAYLQARFVTGARSAIDCLRPFFIYAIGHFDGQAFDAEAITKFLAENYNLRVPVYMLHEVVSTLENEGCLEKSKISDVRICRDINKNNEANEKAPEFSDAQITALEKKLVEFAIEKKQEKPLTAKSWSEALISFFQSEAAPAASKTQNVDGVLISDPSYFDNKLVGDFILKISETNKELFSIVEKIYFGVLVHDFLVRLETSGNKTDYKDLEVVYDTTVLMRLLGTSGRHLRTATLEMHQTLQDLTYVHTAREIALEESKGHVSLLRKLNMREILQRAEEQSQIDRDVARGEGAEFGDRRARAAIGEFLDQRAYRLARYVTRILAAILLALCAILFFLTAVTFPLPSALKLTANIFVAAIGVVSLIELFGYKLPKFSEWLHKKMYMSIVAAQKFLGLR